MTPVDMLVLHDPDRGDIGDCMRASVASVFDLDPADVPHFADIGTRAGDTDETGYAWWLALRGWLRDRNLDVYYVPADQLPEYRRWTATDHVLADGRSPRGPWHCVVADLDGQVVHDPHPSRIGVTPRGFYVFVQLDTEEAPCPA